MRRVPVLLLCLLVFSCLYAQNEKMKPAQRFEKIFRHNHISFTAATNWTQKAKTENTGGPYSVGAQTMRGWEAGVNYHIHFRDKSYSLIIGLHGLAIPRNYALFIPKEDFTPPQQEDFSWDKKLTRTIDMHFSLPVLLEKRWQENKNSFWNLNGGVAIGFYPDEIYEGWYHSNGFGQPAIYSMNLLVTGDYKPWLNYIIAGGHNWILRNNNIIRVNLQANHTSFNLAKGDYEVNVPGQPLSTGTYKSRLSGAGLSVTYILSSSRKKMVREYKRELKQKGF